MSSWAVKRQVTYISVVVGVLIVVSALPVYYIFIKKTPTCYDNILNQNETGIDCGGVCNKVCPNDIKNVPSAVWSRAFKVTDGVYNLVAYIQNPNINYVSEPISYSFKVYDVNNVLIATREGQTSIPPNKSFPIFEAAVNVGQRVPAQVFFEFGDGSPSTFNGLWHRFTDQPVQFEVNDTVLLDASTSPRLSSSIRNDSIQDFSNIEVVAVIYDMDGNAMAASQTIVDSLARNSSQPVIFTWPKGFSSAVSKIEIVPRFPFTIH
ncbi:MAG: hypothetical protein PHF79_03600 [Candidatus Pacebacteria bacterium]|nr:hypothetical protein [Candidatus Paceibacterota bacterium]